MSFLYVGVGAFIGACARYGITKVCVLLFGSSFPLGTLLSNVIAAVLIGFIFRASLARWQLTDNHKLFLTTGMLGGLSTLSTLSMETVGMFKAGNLFTSGANIVLNMGLSICGVLLGMWIADMIYAR